MIYLNSIWKWYWGAPTKFKGKRSVYPNPGRLVISSNGVKAVPG